MGWAPWDGKRLPGTAGIPEDVGWSLGGDTGAVTEPSGGKMSWQDLSDFFQP